MLYILEKMCRCSEKYIKTPIVREGQRRKIHIYFDLHPQTYSSSHLELSEILFLNFVSTIFAKIHKCKKKLYKKLTLTLKKYD